MLFIIWLFLYDGFICFSRKFVAVNKTDEENDNFVKIRKICMKISINFIIIRTHPGVDLSVHEVCMYKSSFRNCSSEG